MGIEVQNPGVIRLGIFVKATFRAVSQKSASWRSSVDFPECVSLWRPIPNIHALGFVRTLRHASLTPFRDVPILHADTGRLRRILC